MPANAATLCQAIIRLYPIVLSGADDPQHSARHRMFAAMICLLEIAREAAHIPRDKLSSLGSDHVASIAHDLFSSITSEGELKILCDAFHSYFPDLTEAINKPLLQQEIKKLNSTIPDGPKLFGGPSYYSQLYRSLFVFQSAFITYVNSRSILDVAPITPYTSPPQLLENLSIASLYSVGRVIREQLNGLTEEDFLASALSGYHMYRHVMSGAIASTFALGASLKDYRASALSHDRIHPLIDAEIISAMDAWHIPLVTYQNSALSDPYMQIYILNNKISAREALAISKEMCANSALHLTFMQNLFLTDRMSIAEGLALPRRELDARYILSLDETQLTPPQRIRHFFYQRYQKRGWLDVESEVPSVADCMIHYVELAVLLSFKDHKTAQESRELALLLEGRVEGPIAVRIAALEHNPCKTLQEKRELALWQYHCLSDTRANPFKAQQIRQLLTLERRISDSTAQAQEKEALADLYFDLCFNCVPASGEISLGTIAIGPATATLSLLPDDDTVMSSTLPCQRQNDINREQLKRQMDYVIRTQLVFYYLQEINKIPSATLALGTMPGYIADKIAALRIGITKYFVESCIPYSQDTCDRLIVQIREKIQQKTLTLNEQDKIMSLSTWVLPLMGDVVVLEATTLGM